MSELPKGWQQTKLAEVATLKTGPFGSALHKSDYTNGGIPLINPTHIRGGRLAPANDVAVSVETSGRLSEYQLNEGDIVMGRRGEMGRCAVVPPYAQGWLCGTGSVVIKSTDAIAPQYLQRFLTAHETVARLVGDSVGSTMVNLNQGVLLGLEVPLAPLPEQKRIADKLDSVLGRVDACRDRLDRLPALLKRFRQSILAAATSGRLTEDWRAAQQKHSATGPFEALLSKDRGALKRGPFGSAIKKSFFVADGYKVYEQKNAIQDDESLGGYYIDEEKFKELSDFSVRPGDFIVSCAGTIGRIARLSETARAGVINQALMRVRIDEARVLPDYFLHVFQSPDFQKDILEKTQGSAMQNMAAVKVIKQVQVRIPSIDEQLEIVRRVETLFAFADRLEARLATARKQAEQLTPALLAKAFRGELVPQDPNDEPATELLKRLATTRSEAPKAKRGRARASIAANTGEPTC